MEQTLLAELDDTILVEFSHFVLQEVPMLRIADSGQATAEQRSVSGPGGIVFRSRASDHYPAVRLELWSARPEPPAGRWDITEESTTNVAGELRLKSIAAEMSEHAIRLPQPGEYGAIVRVRDDPQLDDLEEGSFIHTAERWLVQLWYLTEAAPPHP